MGLEAENRKAGTRCFKRLKLEQMARACGIGAEQIDRLEPYVDAAAAVFAIRSELLEGVTVTPEIMEAVRLTSLPIVEGFNELSAEVSELGRRVEALIEENNTLVALLGIRLGVRDAAEQAIERRLGLVENPDAGGGQ